jgi:hypothetical protein
VSLDEEVGKTAFATPIFCPKNPMAKHNPKAPTLETMEKVFTIEHESFSFKTPHVSWSLLKSPEFVSLSAACFYVDHNHLLTLIF